MTGHRMKAIFSLAVAMTLGFSTGSAATLDDLYGISVKRAQILSPGQSQRTEDEEIRLAMAELLVKITGRLDAATEPRVADMLANPRNYLDHYGLLDQNTMFVRFNARAVEAALIARDQPIWGAERPLTMLMVAIDSGQGERDILAANEGLTDLSPEFQELQSRYREELLTVAAERGLPISLPLMDAEDMNAVNFVDLWGGFDAEVNQALVRYPADAVLIGRARVTRFGANVRWTLHQAGEEIPLIGSSMRDGLDRLADYYSAEFSTLGGVSPAVITVLGVRSLDDYGQIMRYLESLSMLEAVKPAELAGGDVSILVEARGGGDVLARVLGLSTLLTPVEEPSEGRGLTFLFTP